MAEIVIGVASSHTPQLSSGVDMWLDHAERDRRNPQLLGKDARYHTYDELLADAPTRRSRASSRPQSGTHKYRRCQEAIEALTATLAKAQPGHRDRDRRRPAGAVHRRRHPRVRLLHRARARGHAAGRGSARSASPRASAPRTGPCTPTSRRPTRCRPGPERARRRAARLATTSTSRVVRQQPAGRTLGHAFTFPRYRLGLPHGHADRPGLREHLLPAERAVRRPLLPPRQGAARAPCRAGPAPRGSRSSPPAG